MIGQDNEQRLREYYQSELSYLRKSGIEFARQHPRIAGRLELGTDIVPDPFTERLIESFAWLTGRIRYSINARIPQLSTTLLGAIYPNFTAPVPSLSMAQFHPNVQRTELADGVMIPPETHLECSSLETSENDTIILKWQTAWSVTLYPVHITRADFQPAGRYGFTGAARHAASVLRLRLVSETVPLEQCNIKNLRIFLNGNRFETFALYEKLLLQRMDIGLFNPDSTQEKTEPVLLGKEAIRPVGLTADEFVLPQTQFAMPSYQLLQEYFSFPERFLFLELAIDLKKHLAALTQNTSLRQLDLLIPLEMEPRGLNVSPEMFNLYVTPIVNLFEKISEPIHLDDTQSEYRLLPDAKRNKSTEIHSIKTVSMIDPENGNTLPVEPFFSANFSEPENLTNQSPQSYWMQERTPSAGISGTDVWLRFVDSKFNTSRIQSRTVFARILCTNRSLASEAQIGTKLQSGIEIPCRTITLLTKPTESQTPPMDGESLWMLISHLSLNYLSLEGEDGADVLREILRLYIPRENSAAQRLLPGLQKMRTEPIIRRMGHVPWRGFVRGLGIELTLNDTCFTGNSAYLFAEVMNEFFRLYTEINTCTELTWRSTLSGEIRKRWQPEFGFRTKL
ncbi:MAG: type VI secretion system baseplate subunit TssF [Planctomycetaceae bacterium]|jgi:type VI secretion system protein ImpG|nr:type VI secretion system baseplate subunit TssF [Planctomycetaceae bacterium]